MQIDVYDNFLPNPEHMRASALASGFGSWRPGKGDLGAPFYDGVNFWGDHLQGFRALHQRLGQIIPSSMFFRVTNPSMERARIHSDREYGDRTAIIYLSDGPGPSGTGFYRHRVTGLMEMPTIEELRANPPLLERLRADMLSSDDKEWEMYRFVEARYNRCVVFDAPLIHCRIPMTGYGQAINDSRMVWVAHFSEVAS